MLPVAGAERVVEHVRHRHLVAQERAWLVRVVGRPVERHLVAPGVGARAVDEPALVRLEVQGDSRPETRRLARPIDSGRKSGV